MLANKQTSKQGNGSLQAYKEQADKAMVVVTVLHLSRRLVSSKGYFIF